MEKILPSVGTGLQEKGDVARGDDLGGHADDETHHAHAYGTDNVPELLIGVSTMYRSRIGTVDVTNLLLEPVGAIGNAHREDTGEHPWGSAHEQSRHVAKSKSLRHGRLQAC